MDDICEYCGLYGCDSYYCKLNKDNYEICECCGLTGHNKNECSFKNIVKKINKVKKSIVNHILSNFPGTIINIKDDNIYGFIQKNIIITYPECSTKSTIKCANIILSTPDAIGKALDDYLHEKSLRNDEDKAQLLITMDTDKDKKKSPNAEENMNLSTAKFMMCQSCDSRSVVNEAGCLTCQSCGWSKCD